jgi:hypothetical protein
MKFTAIALLSVLCLKSYAQEIIKTDITVDARADETGEVKRIQDRVRMGFTIDAGGVVEIVGLVATGPSFNNDWVSVASNNNSNAHQNLAFRNLYLRKVIGKTTLEGGALNSEPTVGAAGLGSAGWIDGIRVKTSTKVGDFKVIAGSLGDFSTPDAFQRSFNGNFLEIEMSKKVLDKLTLSGAYENLDGDNYGRADIKYDLTILGDQIIHLFADALMDVDKNAYNYEAGAEMDLLKTILHKYENRVELKVYVSHLDSDLGTRNSMISAYYTTGTRVTAQIGGKVTKNGNINWYVRGAFGQSNRVDVGVQMKIPTAKKR